MKKHILPIVFVMAAISNACATSPIEQYIKGREPNLKTLEIIEEGTIDSLYSPFNTYLSAKFFYNKFVVELSGALDMACEASSRDDSYNILLNALIKVNNEESEISSALNRAIANSFEPFVGPDFNRIGQNVKYKANGATFELIFIYNQDGETIGHTSVHSAIEGERAVDLRSTYRKAKALIETQIEGVKSGKIRYNSWE